MLTASQIQVVQSLLANIAPPPPAKLLREVIERYLVEHVAIDLKPSTQSWTRLACKRLVELFGDMPVDQIGRLQAIAIYKRWSRQTSSMITNRLKRVLRLARQWGENTKPEEIPASLSRVWSKPRTKVVLGGELEGLLAALVEIDGRDFPRNRLESTTAAIRFLLATGLRASEVCGLSWDRVGPDCLSLYLDDSKTGPRWVTVGHVVAAMLDARPRRGHWVFPGRTVRSHVSRRTVLGVMREACNCAGISGAVLHSMRHTWATQALQIGIHTRYMQAALGWSSEREAQRYAHVQAHEVRDAADKVAVMLIKKGGGP